MSAAQRLDAADGVMDGRFYGRPIVQQGAAPVQAFGGFQQAGFPQTFGAPVGFPQGGFVQQGFPQAGFAGASAAARLDAADGVMDGRFHGRPIVQAGAPVQTFGAPVFGGQTFGAPVGFPQTFTPGSTAAALDAADGVMDGRFHGRPIVQAGGPVQTFGAPVGFQQGFVGTRTIGAPAGFVQQGFGGVSSTAAALDAADGVIDGRHFGRPIIQGASTFVQNPPIIGAPIGAPVGFQQGGFIQQGGFPQTFGAPMGFPQGGLIQQGGFGGSAAARLDAADGVMDGRFHGRPIVQA